MVYFYIWMVVQIVVESLPVSSSGHQMLLERLMPYFAWSGEMIVQDLFLLDLSIKKYIDHSLHLVTVAVIGFSFLNARRTIEALCMSDYTIILRWIALAGIADLITTFFYVVFSYYNITIPLSLGFIVTAFFLFSTRFLMHHRRVQDPKLWHGLVLGFFQGMSLLTGISRFATTVAAGCWCGFSLYQSVLVSLFIELPLISAAGFLALLKLYMRGMLGIIFTWQVLAVIGVAGVGAYIALQWAISLAQREQWWWFGIYMIIPIILALIA